MAALPNTGITTSMVAQAIGVGSNDVGTLCSHSNVNKWSRFRPGYWYCPSNGSNIQFVKPDGTTRDYRSAESSIRGYMRYHLGDFRKYNHDATPIVFHTESMSIPYNPSATSVDLNYTFDTSDVDWRCVETQVNAVNRLNPNGGECTRFIIKDSTGNVLGYAAIPSTNTLLTIPFTVSVSGVTKTITVELWLGDESHPSGFAKFPNDSSLGFEGVPTITFTLTPQSLAPQVNLTYTSGFVTFIQDEFYNEMGITGSAVSVNPSLLVDVAAGITSYKIVGFYVRIHGSDNKDYEALIQNGSSVKAKIEYYINSVLQSTQTNVYLNYKVTTVGGDLTATFNHSLAQGELARIWLESIPGLMGFAQV